MISSYGSQIKPPGIILHIIIVLLLATSIARMLQTPYVLYMQLQHQGNS